VSLSGSSFFRVALAGAKRRLVDFSYAPIDGRFLIGSEVSLISGSFKLPKIQLT